MASNHYPTVVLGRNRTRTVHSLVAAAFLGPKPDGHEVRHKNGDRSDPRASNLEYGTRTENIRDAIRHGSWMSEKRRDAARRTIPSRCNPEARVKAWVTRRARYGSGGCRS